MINQLGNCRDGDPWELTALVQLNLGQNSRKQIRGDEKIMNSFTVAVLGFYNILDIVVFVDAQKCCCVKYYMMSMASNKFMAMTLY